MMRHEDWRTAFWEAIQRPEIAEPLRNATLEERLRDWTTILTEVAVMAIHEDPQLFFA